MNKHKNTATFDLCFLFVIVGDVITAGMHEKEASFVRDQYSNYMYIVDSFVKVDSVGEVNISSVCRSATLALASPTAFKSASAVARAVIFEQSLKEV